MHKGHISTLHLHDNDTLTDQHKPPMTGCIDWNDVLDALDEVIKKEKIEATSELQTLRSLLTPSVADEMERHKEMISSLVTLIIIRMAYAEPQFYEAKYKRDEVLKQALNLLHNSETCKAILKK